MTAYAYDAKYNYGKRSHEIEKHHLRWYIDGIYKNYLTGKGVDVGYAGEAGKFMPVTAEAIGLDLKTPGYDGIHLPDQDYSYVFASHMLEHVHNPKDYVAEWFSKLKEGGHLFIVVPNMYTYERRSGPPSRWNLGHYCFFTVGRLTSLIEATLEANTFEYVHIRENRDKYDYTVPLNSHPQGAYDVEVCVKKIAKPSWELE